MSDIPPNIVGSSAQAGYVQSEAARARDAQRAGQTHAARNNARAIDQAGDTIETGDEDTQVYGDAQDTGGQGRATEEESPEPASADELDANAAGGITTGDDGEIHVDIEA